MRARLIFQRLLHVALPLWREMLIALLFGILTIGSSIALMGTSSWLIAKAALRPSLDKLNVAIVGVRAFGISRAVFRYVERMTSHHVTFKLLKQWRVWFYSAAEELAPAHLNTYRQADLFTRIISDIENLENFYVRVLAPPLTALVVAISMTVFVFILSPILPIVLIGTYTIAGIALPYLSWRINRQSGDSLAASRAQLNTTMLDGIQGMADGIVYGRMDNLRCEVRMLSREVRVQQGRFARTDGFINASHVGLTGITAAVLLAVAIPRIDPLYLAPLVLAVTASFEAFLPLGLAAAYLSRALAAGERLLEVIDADSAIKEPTLPFEIPATIDLKIHKLSFRYEAHTAWVLRDLDLNLPAGRKVAIVGPSGAGKSTLVNLLLRFRQPDAGCILLNDHRLSKYDSSDIRDRIGVVTEQTYLFNTTIHENIRLAKRGTTEEEIYDAARQAHVSQLIESLPQGYKTPVGELGQQLSGGERQRLALARVFLKNPPLLVLDEAFSHLDAVTEQLLLGTLQEWWLDKSVLLITHRLVGMEAMDEIIVLNQGNIVERGTHDILLSQAGIYERMWSQQRQILDQKFVEY
jgi:ATP-binding cassette subfamily C protein CydC